MTTSYTIDSVTESFPNPSIPKVEGEPTYQSIKNVEKLLVENAASVPSELGGGQYGYLGLCLSNTKYNIMNLKNSSSFSKCFRLEWCR